MKLLRHWKRYNVQDIFKPLMIFSEWNLVLLSHNGTKSPESCSQNTGRISKIHMKSSLDTWETFSQLYSYCIRPTDQFGKKWYLINTESSNPWAQYHLFRSSLISSIWVILYHVKFKAKYFIFKAIWNDAVSFWKLLFPTIILSAQKYE